MSDVVDITGSSRTPVRTENIDYNTDLVKHFVRMKGWLPAAIQRSQSVVDRPLRYFTFCAASAVDVFMLEHAKVLRRDKNGRLLGTFFCESDPLSFETIAELVRSRNQGFLGNFEEIVLYKDTAKTRGRTYLSPGGEQISDLVRRQLLVKDVHERMRDAFPFDIINLDAFGTLLPPRQGVVGLLSQALFRILEWQRMRPLPGGENISDFTLYLTAQVDNSSLNGEALAQLIELVVANMERSADFRKCWIDRFGDAAVEEVARTGFTSFFPLAFVKAVIERSVRDGWDVSAEGRFLYTRKGRAGLYHMMCEVLRFKRKLAPKGLFDGDLMVASIGGSQRVSELMRSVPVRADEAVANADISSTVSRHLSEVLEFRKQTLDSLGTG